MVQTCADNNGSGSKLPTRVAGRAETDREHVMPLCPNVRIFKAAKANLSRQPDGMTISEGQDPDVFVSDVHCSVDKVQHNGGVASEAWIVDIVLEEISTGDELLTFHAEKDPAPDLEGIEHTLRNMYIDRSTRVESRSINQVFVIRSGRDFFDSRNPGANTSCKICGKKGHRVSDSFQTNSRQRAGNHNNFGQLSGNNNNFGQRSSNNNNFGKRSSNNNNVGQQSSNNNNFGQRSSSNNLERCADLSSVVFVCLKQKMIQRVRTELLEMLVVRHPPVLSQGSRPCIQRCHFREG